MSKKKTNKEKTEKVVLEEQQNVWQDHVETVMPTASKKKNKKEALEKTVIHEELSEKQQKEFEVWKGHIKAIYGEWGSFTWKITPTGIGSGISVFSHLTKTEIDLTDMDSW